MDSRTGELYASLDQAIAFGVKDATIWGIWGLMLILGVGAWLLSRVHPKPAVLDA